MIFEGTEEQIKNLKAFVKCRSNNLPKIREDYQTEYLWCIEDVKSKFKCDDDDALKVLESALTNDATMEQIWYAIEFHGEYMGLEEVN
jgi:hypothetical protein